MYTVKRPGMSWTLGGNSAMLPPKVQYPSTTYGSYISPSLFNQPPATATTTSIPAPSEVPQQPQTMSHAAIFRAAQQSFARDEPGRVMQCTKLNTRGRCKFCVFLDVKKSTSYGMCFQCHVFACGAHLNALTRGVLSCPHCPTSMECD
jgi:hypothetical protein